MDVEEPIFETLRIAIAAMRDAGVPFVLGGSFAAWARGGPLPQKDLDLMVKPADSERALEALAAAGMRTERPPEEWLVKAWHGDVMVDVIFHPAGLEMTDDVLARADTLSVMARPGIPVAGTSPRRASGWCARPGRAGRRSARGTPRVH